MGYDMYWIQPPERDEAGDAQAAAAFRGAVAARDAGLGDQTAVDQAYAALCGSEEHYYRLNIWGMGVARELMVRFDMLTASSESDFPRVVDEEGYYDWCAGNGPADGEVPESWLTHGEKMDAWLCHADSPEEGIAFHKLCSNDGWIVTPEECRGALAKWKRWCDANGESIRSVPMCGVDNVGARPIEWWPEWVAWLASASQHGGFSVH